MTTITHISQVPDGAVCQLRDGSLVTYQRGVNAQEVCGIGTLARVVLWRRVSDQAGDGYALSGTTARVWDNGEGFGSSRGSGRWAVEVDGKWIANVDTLAEAKQRAATLVAS